MKPKEQSLSIQNLIPPGSRQLNSSETELSNFSLPLITTLGLPFPSFHPSTCQSPINFHKAASEKLTVMYTTKQRLLCNLTVLYRHSISTILYHTFLFLINYHSFLTFFSPNLFPVLFTLFLGPSMQYVTYFKKTTLIESINQTINQSRV